jgi:hypothetical protein
MIDKPQTFYIKADNIYMLQAIQQDLKSLGYNFLSDDVYNKDKKSIAIANGSELSWKTKEDFTNLDSFNFSSKNHNKYFTLPSQYQEALDFAKEQINHPYWDKNKFKVGDWVYWSGISPIIGQIERLNRHDGRENYVLKNTFNSEEYTSCYVSCLRLATTKEVENHLIEEAKKIGFKEGVKFKSLVHSNTIRTIIKDEYHYTLQDDQLINHGNWVYDKGKWAEIISSNKELYFGEVKFTISPNSSVAETSYGNIAKGEIYEAIEYITHPPCLQGHSLTIHYDENQTYHELGKIDKFNGLIHLGFGCKSGNLAQLEEIYNSFD